MVKVQPGAKGELEVYFPYDERLISKIRLLTRRHWDPDRKCWVIPNSADAVAELQDLLKDEEIRFVHFEKSNGKREEKCVKAMGLELLLRGYSPRTRENYCDHLRLFINYLNRDPEELSDAEIRTYLIFLATYKKVSKSYFNQAISAIKFYYHYVIRSPRSLEELPRPGRDKKIPIVLSRDELLKLFEGTFNPKHKLLLMITYSAGLRVSEIVNLRVEDFDFDRNLIRIRSSKGNKDRYTPLAEIVRELMHSYLKIFPVRGWLFPGANGESHLSVRSAEKIFERARDKAGIIKPVSIHILRHSFATHALENGIDLRYVQEILGHSRPETTMIYTHVTEKDINRIRSPLDDFAYDLIVKKKEDKTV